MLLGIKYLSHFLQRVGVVGQLGHSFVGLDDRFVSVFVHFPSEFIQKGVIRYHTLIIICFNKVIHLLLVEIYFSTLQSPLEIILIQHTHSINIQTVQHLMQEPHTIYTSFRHEMFDLFIQSVFIDHCIFYYRLIELLRGL